VASVRRRRADAAGAGQHGGLGRASMAAIGHRIVRFVVHGGVQGGVLRDRPAVLDRFSIGT
jgi:hypothetical protein